MYSIADYGVMLADGARMHAFAKAMRQAVRPGAVVLDIGTGPGIFAVLACRFGARRVYAIEPDDVIQVAREIAAANGFSDRIDFIQGVSTAVSLPERADVITSDIGGALPWFRHHLPAVIDARHRLLAPDGVLIPQRDTAWAAVVEIPDVYRQHTEGWDGHQFGLDLRAGRQLVVNARTSCRVTRDHVLAAPQRWVVLDYHAVADTNARSRMSFAVTRAGMAHGVAAGFDRTVADGIYLSNAPDAPADVPPAQIYGVAFFPWPRPVEVRPGHRVSLELAAQLVGDDYVWTWKTQVFHEDHPDVAIADFDQSTFYGAPLVLDRLHKGAETYRPTLDTEGKVMRLILESMQRQQTVGEIADQVIASFPAHFASRREAVNRVAELCQRYG